MNEKELADLIYLTGLKLKNITAKYIELDKPVSSLEGYSKSAIARCCREIRSTAQEMLRLMK